MTGTTDESLINEKNKGKKASLQYILRKEAGIDSSLSFDHISFSSFWLLKFPLNILRQI